MRVDLLTKFARSRKADFWCRATETPQVANVESRARRLIPERGAIRRRQKAAERQTAVNLRAIQDHWLGLGDLVPAGTSRFYSDSTWPETGLTVPMGSRQRRFPLDADRPRPEHSRERSRETTHTVFLSLAALRAFDGRGSLKIGKQRRDFGH